MYEVKKEKNTWTTFVEGYEVMIKNETSTLGLYINKKLQDVYIGSGAIGMGDYTPVDPDDENTNLTARIELKNNEITMGEFDKTKNDFGIAKTKITGEGLTVYCEPYLGQDTTSKVITTEVSANFLV